jgi:hypothetical protein
VIEVSREGGRCELGDGDGCGGAAQHFAMGREGEAAKPRALEYYARGCVCRAGEVRLLLPEEVDEQLRYLPLLAQKARNL